MKILVTGANGQLGRTLARIVRGGGNTYIFTARMPDEERGIRQLDITDFDAVARFVAELQADVIVNCASFTAVDRAEDEPEMAQLVNAGAVANMAKVAKDNGAVLIHISTDYVFDGSSSVPYADDAPHCPINVYGRSKADAERMVLESGCRHIIFRTSWLYAVEGSNFVKRIIEKSSENPVLNVIFDQIGTPTFADDLARLILQVIDGDMLDRQGIYNYSNEGVCSWYDFAMEICALSGHKCDISPCHTDEYPRKARRPHFSVLDKTGVKKAFGIRIPHWKESLASCISMMMNE